MEEEKKPQSVTSFHVAHTSQASIVRLFHCVVGGKGERGEKGEKASVNQHEGTDVRLLVKCVYMKR